MKPYVHYRPESRIRCRARNSSPETVVFVTCAVSAILIYALGLLT